MTADSPPNADPPLAYATPAPSTVDDEHVRLLALFHFILAGLQVIIGLFPLMHVVMGVMIVNGKFAQMVPPTPNAPANPFPPEIGWIFIVFGSVAIVVLQAVAVMTLLGGLSLRRRRSRIFPLVVAGLNCLYVPFGTVLGVFTIVVLLRPSVIERYRRGGAG